ncbi:MAG: bacillithiol biosynthesis deacetylase BshB1 [Owenweeksia sp.]
MKLDILAFGAHPDDVEISAGGTMARQTQLGYSCGIVDLTRGDLGTRGTPELREKEAQAAAAIMGVKVRENLRFRDGFFRNDEEHQLHIIRLIRKYRPEIVLANAPVDRHPDHGRAGELVKTASFLAGLRKIETLEEGKVQEAYRPRLVLHYIQFQNLKPDIILDIGDTQSIKMKAIQAYGSQFYDPDSKEPKTVISSKGFLESIEYRSKDLGRLIGTAYGEGFVSAQDVGITDLLHLHSVR